MYKWKVVPTEVTKTYYDPDDEKNYAPFKILVKCKSDNPYYNGCDIEYYRSGKGSPDYQLMRELKRENAFLKRKISEYEFFGTLKEIDMKQAEYNALCKYQNIEWKHISEVKKKDEEINKLKVELYDLKNE